ncbi:ABC transporter permease [Maritimibacter sp. HL-12]|jgi:general nucleoside transport system permease protein|uniref:ABC transporter permease n=1 Tax=Maritimibacter sp. HL-12 TaxID=1162418 RepID=UPI000A0EEE07|nr:ABC transporter permease [Maritimibacter sp. HL-12]SMH53726.1 nucleoside ABC transporter membrane protein [Maritimibacter sp. HL-12]
MTDGKDLQKVNEDMRKLLARAAFGRGNFEDLFVVPVFAVVAALVLGALIMLATGVDLPTIGRSFVALAVGSAGSLNAVSETLTAAIPLVLAGLGLGLGFRAGLFNIGAEGQLLLGGTAAVVFTFSFPSLPFPILMLFGLLTGALVGAAYASIAGILKATTGAHEVITTIMLNLISIRLLEYILRQPYIQREGRADPVSKSVPDAGQLPRLLDWLDPNLRLHAGVFLMLLAVAFVWWLLFRSKIGFAFRASGANPDAARYAGMRSGLVIVAAMATAGALAGLAGAAQVQGVLGRASPGFSAQMGFDAIALALLGRSHPVGILFAGILFGGLEAGGRQMQVDAGVSIDLISIIQALIIVFIAAPLLVRAIFPWGFRKITKGGKA